MKTGQCYLVLSLSLTRFNLVRLVSFKIRKKETGALIYAKEKLTRLNLVSFAKRLNSFRINACATDQIDDDDTIGERIASLFTIDSRKIAP